MSWRGVEVEEGEEEDRGRQRPERGWGEEGRSAEGMGALRVLVGKLKQEERGGERKLCGEEDPSGMEVGMKVCRKE